MKNVKNVAPMTLKKDLFSRATIAFAGLVGSSHVFAAADPLTDAGGIFQRGGTLAITALAAVVVIVSVWVIISSMVQVARDRKTWGEVIGAVIGAGVVALVVGGLATFAVTQIAAIAAP